MYRQYWGLNRAPFAEGLDPGNFFQGATHEEALARLHFLVEEHQRVGLLLGKSGCGKSLLLAVLAKQLARKGHHVATINLVGEDQHGFLWQAAAALFLSPERDAQTFQLWRMLQDRLAENRYQQFSTVLLLDDAEEATPDVLTQVVRMIQADLSPQVRLSVVLSAQGSRLNRLGERLLDLADLRIDVEPWDAHDTAEYIHAALSQSGRSAPVFADDAVACMHELTGGIPRRVKQLAQLALLAGAGRELSTIDAETIDAVHDELGVVLV